MNDRNRWMDLLRMWRRHDAVVPPKKRLVVAGTVQQWLLYARTHDIPTTQRGWHALGYRLITRCDHMFGMECDEVILIGSYFMHHEWPCIHEQIERRLIPRGVVVVRMDMECFMMRCM